MRKNEELLWLSVELALVMVACWYGVRPSADVPRPAPTELAPLPPELEEPPARRCHGYCATIDRCWPEDSYPECEADCLQLLADPEASAVSGFTPALVQCWSAATNCQLAAACDAAADGDRKK